MDRRNHLRQGILQLGRAWKKYSWQTRLVSTLFGIFQVDSFLAWKYKKSTVKATLIDFTTVVMKRLFGPHSTNPAIKHRFHAGLSCLTPHTVQQQCQGSFHDAKSRPFKSSEALLLQPSSRLRSPTRPHDEIAGTNTNMHSQ